MEAPYYAVIFRSVLKENFVEYKEVAQKMEALVKDQPGFLGMEHLQGASNTRITICYWQNEEDLKNWKDVPDHIEAQEAGKEHWYESYAVEIARVERTHSSDLEGTPEEA